MKRTGKKRSEEERRGIIMRDFYDPRGGKKGKFALRENTYRRIWYLIADYRYFKCIQAGIEGAEFLQRDSAAAGVHTIAVPQITEKPVARRQGRDSCVTAGTLDVYKEGGAAGVTAETPAAYRIESGRFDMGQIDKYIKAIEEALEKVPVAYADYVMEHIINRMRYKDMEGVSERTMKLWVQRFIWLVAQNLGEI